MRIATMIKGTYTALVTPFNSQNEIDIEALKNLVNWQIGQGIDGIVVCGSTGESFVLSTAEQTLAIKTVVEAANKRIPIIAGVSAIAPKDTIALAKNAEEFAVDGLMVVTPPYVKPTQQAIYDYFKQVHDATNTPIIIYDNPGRCGTSLSDDVVIKLAKLPRIVCLKDASGDLARPAILRGSLPNDFSLMSGEDATTPAFLAQGGDGVISVTANVAPNLVTAQCKAWNERDLQALAYIQTKLTPLHKAIFIESSPAPAKYALSTFKLCSPYVRAPLVEVKV